MEMRKLGRCGPTIAPLVLGGNVFGWTADETTSFALLDRFVERGFNAIDTADVYSAWAEGNNGGESETVLGRWLKHRGRREDVIIMTKVGMWEAHKGLSADNIRVAVESSLRRLQTDYIDVYFAHLDDQTTPLEETLEAFSRLVDAGKVRCLGASNYTGERLSAALRCAAEHGLARYEVIQPQYNLYDRADYEQGLASHAQQEELGVVSYFALASGFLTGKYRSQEDLQGSQRTAFLQRYFNPRGDRILKALEDIAAQTNATPAQLSLAWLLAQPALSAPIASATRIEQLDQILDAVELQLSEDVLRQLDEASA